MGRRQIERIVVVGGGGHAKVLISVLKKSSGYEPIGYTDVRDSGELLGMPYLGTDSILEKLRDTIKDCCAAVGVGKVTINAKRMQLVRKLIRLGFRLPAVISPHALVNEDVTIGDGTVVFDGAVVNTGARIKRASIINTNSIVEHDCVIGDNVHIAPGASLSGEVRVGDNCMIGTGANVIQGIGICADCLIGAGTTVVNNITIPGVYVGNPAERIK
jgi:sugar O-acyltransferase (sialic acid O-acetyltransferase NeuD family)